jgi:TRAP transporter T-component
MAIKMIFASGTLLILSACVSMTSLTVKGTASIAPLAEISLRQESSLAAFRTGAPGGLQLLEASLLADPKNKSLLSALAKGYQGYAMIIAETDMLEESLSENSQRHSQELAVDYHTRAVARAKIFLQESGMAWPDMTKAGVDVSSLSSFGGDQNIIDLAFVASSSLKSLSALQRGKPAALAYLPAATLLSEFACSGKLKPSYPTWACQAMNGVELAEKPVMIGGDLGKSAQIFADVAKSDPRELFPQALEAQHLLSKKKNDGDWKRIKDSAQIFKATQFERQTKVASSQGTVEPDSSALLNAAALRRIEILTAHEKDFF